jgi:hypothetical protein
VNQTNFSFLLLLIKFHNPTEDEVKVPVSEA